MAQLLAMLAPIVMGVLGRMKRQQGVDAASLPNVLQQSATAAPGGFDLGSILDSNNDGKFDLGGLGGMLGKR